VLDVFTGITALADKSLVRPLAATDPEPRFGMLETIREFGLEQLAAAGELDATRCRHASYFVGFTEALSAELFQATRPELLERLATERDNIRAALAWLDQQGDEEAMIRHAGGMGWFWFVRGLGTEGISWLERARSPRSAVAPRIRAAALNWASVLTLPRKDHAASTELAALSVRLLRESGDESASLAMALLSQGRATGYSGDRAKGIALLEEALALARDLDHPLFIGAILDSLAEFAFLDGDLEKAATLVTEALDLQRRHQPLWGTSFSLALRRSGSGGAGSARAGGGGSDVPGGGGMVVHRRPRSESPRNRRGTRGTGRGIVRGGVGTRPAALAGASDDRGPANSRIVAPGTKLRPRYGQR
jgi:tetratricopeptide (TPR) repeat protein